MISDSVLNRLTAEQLSALADDLDAQARNIRLRAARAETREKIKKDARASAERVRMAADNAARAGGSGNAIQRAAKTFHCPPDAVAAMLDAAARSRADIDRDRRNMMIMRLAERGWTNGRIADRFRLTASTVSRIIQRALRH